MEPICTTAIELSAEKDHILLNGSCLQRGFGLFFPIPRTPLQPFLGVSEEGKERKDYLKHLPFPSAHSDQHREGMGRSGKPGIRWPLGINSVDPRLGTADLEQWIVQHYKQLHFKHSEHICIFMARYQFGPFSVYHRSMPHILSYSYVHPNPLEQIWGWGMDLRGI